MTVIQNINRLVKYGLINSLITADDIIYTQNKLLELFRIDGFEDASQSELPENVKTGELEEILKELLDYAAEQKLFEDTGIASRDLFDTKIMGQLVPPPSDVREIFQTLKEEAGAKAATDWYYKFNCDTDYIRRYRVSKDLKWKTATKYGELDITINLSKPEKDPKAIAAARNMKQSGYPACLLCKENEGYAGRLNHPARQTHRIIPLKLNDEDWFMQYSPYVYYNEHCIVFDAKHEPMKICHETFVRLIDFVKQFPHYTLGSNADIPIVGGSILTHNHFQGGCYEFPMAKATIQREFKIKGFSKVKAAILNWPMSVIRLTSKNDTELIEAADYILNKWRGYTDESAFIYAETNGEKHNTITPIARMRDGKYELDLVLRNNITTEEHPLGVYHPHANLHHIKKENIGLIEVMGLAVLPSRLKQDLAELERNINADQNVYNIEHLAHHADWVSSIKPKYQKINQEALQYEVGQVFCQVLEDAGVFKQTEEGQAAFTKFTSSL